MRSFNRNTFKKARLCSGLLVLGLGVVSFIAPSYAQSGYELDNRMKRLENEIETLSRAVYRGEQPPAGSLPSSGLNAADIEVRLQQIEREMRELRGMLEKQAHDVRKVRSDMERITSDLELRMNELEKKGRSNSSSAYNQATKEPRYTAPNASANTAPEPRETQSGGDEYSWSSSNRPKDSLGTITRDESGATVTDKDEATSLYENAFALIRNRQYGGAEAEFKRFLDTYPKHALAGNAKYWLGETFYVRGKFDEAAKVFAEGYREYPKGSKAADNLLKLGMALAGLGKTSDACIALQQLDKNEFSGNASVKSRARQEAKRLGC